MMIRFCIGVFTIFLGVGLFDTPCTYCLAGTNIGIGLGVCAIGLAWIFWGVIGMKNKGQL